MPSNIIHSSFIFQLTYCQINYLNFFSRFTHLENDNINLKENHNRELNQINSKIDSMIKSKNDECDSLISKVILD